MLCLRHVISFLFLYLDKVSLEFFFCYFLLNYLSSSVFFLLEIQTLPTFPQNGLWITEDLTGLYHQKHKSSEKGERGRGFLTRLLKTLSLAVFVDS